MPIRRILRSRGRPEERKALAKLKAQGVDASESGARFAGIEARVALLEAKFAKLEDRYGPLSDEEPEAPEALKGTGT